MSIREQLDALDDGTRLLLQSAAEKQLNQPERLAVRKLSFGENDNRIYFQEPGGPPNRFLELDHEMVRQNYVKDIGSGAREPEVWAVGLKVPGFGKDHAMFVYVLGTSDEADAVRITYQNNGFSHVETRRITAGMYVERLPIGTVFARKDGVTGLRYPAKVMLTGRGQSSYTLKDAIGDRHDILEDDMLHYYDIRMPNGFANSIVRFVL